MAQTYRQNSTYNSGYTHVTITTRPTPTNFQQACKGWTEFAGLDIDGPKW